MAALPDGDPRLDDGSETLAVYGSLAPGETNHWVVSRIKGEWKRGTVAGHVFEITWGAAEGYLGFLPDDEGPPIDVAVLTSNELDKKWREIDDFEGPGYERRPIEVHLDSDERCDAQIYVALTDN